MGAALTRRKRLAEAPRGVSVTVGAPSEVGDIGLVGLPCEPLLGIGRQIRAGAPLPLTIPVGYMNDNIGYVPDSPNLGDTEFSRRFLPLHGVVPCLTAPPAGISGPRCGAGAAASSPGSLRLAPPCPRVFGLAVIRRLLSSPHPRGHLGAAPSRSRFGQRARPTSSS